MKINDRHLASFATSNSPTDKEGWLYKRGEVNKAFQKRWFLLKGNLLFYFEKKIDKEPIGVIILEGCTVELAVTNDDNLYTFELVFPGSTARTYVMAAETQEDMESWMKAITCAGYEYLKLMVTELQRQLDEVTMLNANSLQWTQSHRNMQQSSSSGAPLIDIGSPDHSSSGGAVGGRAPRINPFDKDPAVDSFGSSPFLPHGNLSSPPQGFRSFEEMHETYGRYVKQKFAQKITSQTLFDS